VSRPRLKLAAFFVAVSVLGLMSAQAGFAAHVRPKGATPKYDQLVISYKSCPTPNAAHSGPGSWGSCVPPSPTSPWLTAGTADSANALPANFLGFTRLTVCPPPGGCSPGPPGADIKVDFAVQDVRCTAAMASNVPAACPSGTFGPYTGSVEAVFPTEWTDHCNGTTPPACPAPTPPPPNAGTGPSPGPFSLPLKFVAPCAPGPPGSGGACGLTSTVNVLVPGRVVANARANIEVGQVFVNDGGPDGNAATADNIEYANSGVFVP
jgi:hypothetical protein